ncbi:MAG: two-component regulator propeller domain-containing protein [Reichenbachiella sp.]|uniref:hybrid sensor histidine kinase/response regulator transcription factor n=2 Tax=Reichenbachiella sp. TaxID=2184521 RepID=UPI003262F9BA
MMNRLNWFCLLITWLLVPMSVLRAQEEGTPYFMHLTKAHGAPIQRVIDIAFDHLGFAWVASSNGLYRFDGHRFEKVSFLESIGTPEANNVVENILVDDDGTVWIAVKFYGVYTYSYDTGQFTKVVDGSGQNITEIKLDKNNLYVTCKNGAIIIKNLSTGAIERVKVDDFIYSVEPDESGGLWVGTFTGLYKWSILQGIQKVQLAINPAQIEQLTKDSKGGLWLATGRQGVVYYDPKSKKSKRYSTSMASGQRLESDFILSLFLDSKENLWVSTDGGGVARINVKTGELTNYNQDPADENSLTSKSVMCVKEDRHGNYWMGNNFGGVNVLINQSHGVTYYKGVEKGRSYRILSLLKSSSGDIWAGTDGEGIVLHQNGSGSNTQRFSKTTHPGLIGNYIQKMIELRNGDILIGTYDFGLSYFDYQSRQFKKINSLAHENKQESVGEDIRSLFEDKEGRIWMGTEKALYVLDQALNIIKVFSYDVDLSCSVVIDFAQRKNGQIIVGTMGGGLSVIDQNLSKPTPLMVKTDSSVGRFEHDVMVMRLQDDGMIWIGTQNHGLFFIDPDNQILSKFRHEAFQNGFITILETTDKDRLWIGTTNGLYEWNGKDKVLNAYSDRLNIINRYMKRSSFKDTEGLLYFGGINGFYKLRPDRLNELPAPNTDIYFTDLFINNSDETYNHNLLKVGMELATDIELEHTQSNFAFGFTALGSLTHGKHALSYRLFPFDQEWKQAGEDRLATYTNLPHGEYTFKVKLSAGIEKEAKEKSLNIVILPPWWRTNWAYTLFVIIGVSLLFLSYRYTYQWAKLKNQWKYEKLTREKEKEINNMKLDFFTKMSHEIRTPLTLILGPIERIKEMIQDNYRATNYISIVQSNAQRLVNLTEQIMDLRKNETGELQLRATNQDITALLKEVIATFSEVARQKNIEFEHQFPDQIGDFWYDHEKVEHILFNLLSNAFKYSLSESKVRLTLAVEPPSLNYQKGALNIAVSDTGIGMNDSTLEHVFDMFYRSEKQTEEGHGVGLALTRELVKLHKGEIEVSSAEGVGTTFEVRLHLGDAHLTEHEKIYRSTDQTEIPMAADTRANGSVNIEPANKQVKLLLVEDNPQMLDFIKSIFIESYNVITAENGSIGLDLARSEVPDVIISDVVMPEMDGFEMTHYIKNDSKVSHIPVLLLTARTTGKHTIEGLEIGADDYMTKPFQVEVLKLKVKNLLETKESAERFIRKELISEPAAVEARDEDEEFLQEIMRIINEQLGDPELKVEMIAREMSMSHSVLYRRCMAITGQTIVDIIKITRLKTAAKLVTDGRLGISEAAYRVGFNDAKYFTKCFKNYFGTTPSDYVSDFKATV